ncbi:DUF2846 domain-containing protein [Caenimonas koreensis]|uniref:DUF2846 domain-containing protein n=1 Tax=Caenimonas koreensis TaxID=367474 RepID=UPI003782E97C
MKKLACSMLVLALFTGCASVNMESKEASAKAKQFAQPQAGKAGLYVYRDSFVGKALKKDLWLDGTCIGESAPDVFFYTEAAPGTHTLSTESEFSPNDISILVEAGKNYFYRQFIKMGLMVGGADLEPVAEAEAKAAIAKLELAKAGTCSGTYTKK